MTQTPNTYPAGIPPDRGCPVARRCTRCPLACCVGELTPAEAAAVGQAIRLVQAQQQHRIATDQAAAMLGMDRGAAVEALTAAVFLLAGPVRR